MSDGLPPQGLFANLSKSAGAATKMVALQAERTKLATMTLPAAYRALGKDCLKEKRHLDCVTDLTDQLRSVLAEIKKLTEVAATQPTPQSLTDKAKAAGIYAVDVARQKQLGMKRNSLIASIGKAIYEKHLGASGPIELVGPIKSAMDRNTQLETEVGQQSQVGKGMVVSLKRNFLSLKSILVSVFPFVVLLILAGRLANSCSKIDSATSSREAITIYSERLVAKYEENQIAADKEYKGKILEVEGFVGEISKDFFGYRYVTLTASKHTYRTVQCFFGGSSESKLVELRPNQILKIRGRCEGQLIHVVLHNCTIVQ